MRCLVTRNVDHVSVVGRSLRFSPYLNKKRSFISKPPHVVMGWHFCAFVGGALLGLYVAQNYDLPRVKTYFDLAYKRAMDIERTFRKEQAETKSRK